MASEPSATGVLVEKNVLGRSLRYCSLRVTAQDGVSLAVQDWAPDRVGREVDIVLLHGFSQAHGAWLHQVSGTLAKQFRLVTYDIRGHGDSDKPADAAYYRDGQRWADEVKAVIEQARLRMPVLLAWSYAGRIVLDYLTAYGDRAVSGLIMVNATSNGIPGMLGPAVARLRQMTSADPAVAHEGTLALLRACVAKPPLPSELEYMLRYNEQVPPHIRAHLAGRPANYEATLRALRIPTLVVHGLKDPVTLPAMSAYTLAQVPRSQSLVYENAAHMPFWEEPERFDDDVGQFIRDKVLNQHCGHRKPGHGVDASTKVV